jgi:hypothetical protein
VLSITREHVDAEIDRLTQWYEQLEVDGIHPVIVAAWLHHRFRSDPSPSPMATAVSARALASLLVLQRHQLARS